MTQPLSYEIITPGGYVMDKITHKARCEQWTAIVNTGYDHDDFSLPYGQDNLV